MVVGKSLLGGVARESDAVVAAESTSSADPEVGIGVLNHAFDLIADETILEPERLPQTKSLAGSFAHGRIGRDGRLDPYRDGNAEIDRCG